MPKKSERDQKIFASHLENIKAKTGKTPDDFRVLAAKKGLEKNSEIVAWLETNFALGHGRANAIAHLPTRAEAIKASPEGELRKFGSDIEIAPNRTDINLCRGTKKFGIVQISSADRIDIGIKLKGATDRLETERLETERLETERLKLAGPWNAMVKHRVRIADAKEIDAEVLAWLKQAYEAS